MVSDGELTSLPDTVKVPSDGIWWTVRVRDPYGSTIFADPIYFEATR